jgi:integrase
VAATIRRIHQVLHGLLAYAVCTGKIPSTPASGHDLPRPNDDERVFLTYQQADALLAAAGEEWATLLEVLTFTGIRWGEASALRVGDVLLQERRLWVAGAYTKVKGQLVRSDTKNHERRKVPLLPSVATDLGVLIKGRKADELVFTLDGGPIKYRKINYEFGKIVKKADLDGLDLTSHKLRHTAASMAISSGANVKVVQTMLGHKTATMTLDTYGHLWPDDLDEVANRMDVARRRSRLKAA